MTRTRLLGIAFLLCLAGIYTTWMLSFAYLLGLQLPCGGDSGCITIALGPGARAYGVPLPVIGLAFYVVLALATVRSLLGRPFSRLTYWLAFAGAAVSTGLTVYSVLVLHATCVWCIASNVTACCLALVYGSERAEDPVERTKRGVAFLAGSSVAILAAMGISANIAYRTAQRFPWDPVALAKESADDMAPTDTLVLAGKEPTVVMFVDLQCPACQAAFGRMYRLAQADGFRLAIRHLPERIHPRSYALSVLCEEAEQQGQGANFVLGVIKGNIDHWRDGLALLHRLGVEESPQTRHMAKGELNRDRALAKRLRLSQTPSTFVLTDGQGPTPASDDSLAELIGSQQNFQ